MSKAVLHDNENRPVLALAKGTIPVAVAVVPVKIEPCIFSYEVIPYVQLR